MKLRSLVVSEMIYIHEIVWNKLQEEAIEV